MRVLIMVLHANCPPWDRLAEDGIRGTWWGVDEPGVQSIFYQGGGAETALRGDVLDVGIPEHPHMMGYKNLIAFKYALWHFEFDYVFRVNSSSYVNKGALLRFLADKPRTGYYAGVINGTYISGAGILMSRDVLEKIDANGRSLMHGPPPDEPPWVPEPEDVYLGWLVKSLGVEFSEGRRYNVFEEDRGPALLPVPGLREEYHIRCKNSRNRSEDVRAMKEVHKNLLELKNDL